MDKNFNAWVAVDTVEKGKRYAHVWKFSSNHNMIATFKSLPKADIIHLCKTRKEAVKLVEMWNATHRENGCYMFDEFGRLAQ